MTEGPASALGVACDMLSWGFDKRVACSLHGGGVRILRVDVREGCAAGAVLLWVCPSAAGPTDGSHLSKCSVCSCPSRRERRAPQVCAQGPSAMREGERGPASCRLAVCLRLGRESSGRLGGPRADLWFWTGAFTQVCGHKMQSFGNGFVSSHFGRQFFFHPE